MRTTQEERDGFRKMFDRLDQDEVDRICDDADELARLREGLKGKEETWKGVFAAMERIQELRGYDYERHIGYRYALEDCADEIQELLNGDGDGD